MKSDHPSAQGWNTSISVGQIANHNTAQKTLESNSSFRNGRFTVLGDGAGLQVPLEPTHDVLSDTQLSDGDLARKGKEARTFRV